VGAGLAVAGLVPLAASAVVRRRALRTADPVGAGRAAVRQPEPAAAA